MIHTYYRDKKVVGVFETFSCRFSQQGFPGMSRPVCHQDLPVLQMMVAVERDELCLNKTMRRRRTLGDQHRLH
jgi:hypothetical protein